jgi:hypothetical protein
LGAHIAEGKHMNILDRFFVGEVIQDFGVIEEKSLGIGRMKKSALLAKKDGKIRFVIKMSAVAFLGASVNYVDFEIEDAHKLRQFISQSEYILKGSPYSDNFSAKGIAKELPLSTIISVLVTFVLGSLIIWWLDDTIWVLLATLLLFSMHIGAFQEFKRFEDASEWQQIIPGLLAVASLFIGIGKFILLNFV